MLNKKYEWPADEYAIGNYIQATIAEKYYISLTSKKHHNYWILDAVMVLLVPIFCNIFLKEHY